MSMAWRCLLTWSMLRDYMLNKCYVHVLLHAYDALVASEKVKSVLRDRLGNHFELK